MSAPPVSWRFWTKGSLNELMNDKGVSRTARATTGLLTTVTLRQDILGYETLYCGRITVVVWSPSEEFTYWIFSTVGYTKHSSLFKDRALFYKPLHCVKELDICGDLGYGVLFLKC